jgi:hypothetical protein
LVVNPPAQEFVLGGEVLLAKQEFGIDVTADQGEGFYSFHHPPGGSAHRA